MMVIAGKAATAIGRVLWPSSIRAKHAPIIYRTASRRAHQRKNKSITTTTVRNIMLS